MAYKGVLDDIRKCVALQKPGRIPVFALSEEFDVRMYDLKTGLTYEQYCQDAKKMAACQIDAILNFDYDWCWLQVDDCIEFEVLGVGTKGVGNIVRATSSYLPAAFETLRNLKMPDPRTDGRMPVLLEAISEVKARFGDTVCVTGRTAAPFSSASLLYGLQETLMLPFTNPDLLKATIEFFTELQTAFGIEQISAGADAIWLGDCSASSHLLSPQHYLEFARDSAKKVSHAYQKAGGFVFYHASEEGASLPIMVDTGFSAVSVGPGIDIADALSVAGQKSCLLGNLNPIAVLQNGTSQDVERESMRIIDEGVRAGGLLFNSGEAIPRDTPAENMSMMIRTGKRYGISRKHGADERK